jgi:hypothetical protein
MDVIFVQIEFLGDLRIRKRLLLDSGVVELAMSYNPIFVLFSS